jgi:hypothetical protein
VYCLPVPKGMFSVPSPAVISNNSIPLSTSLCIDDTLALFLDPIKLYHCTVNTVNRKWKAENKTSLSMEKKLINEKNIFVIMVLHKITMVSYVYNMNLPLLFRVLIGLNHPHKQASNQAATQHLVKYLHLAQLQHCWGVLHQFHPACYKMILTEHVTNICLRISYGFTQMESPQAMTSSTCCGFMIFLGSIFFTYSNTLFANLNPFSL